MKDTLLSIKRKGLKPAMMGKKIALFANNSIELHTINVIMFSLGLKFDIVESNDEAKNSQENILVISKG